MCVNCQSPTEPNNSGIDTPIIVENIAEVIEDWTIIPVKDLTESESAKAFGFGKQN